MSELGSVAVHPTPAVEHAASSSYEPFPALAESEYLDLARRAQRRWRPLRPVEGFSSNSYDDLRVQLGVDDIENRLGESLPRLSAAGQDTVLEHFAQKYSSIPDTLPRYQKSRDHADRHHNHDHDSDGSHEAEDHGCNKIHGPVQRSIENFADHIGGKVGSQRTKAAILIGMRSLLFMLCPGDDFVSIGAQVLNGVAPHSVHTDSHQHDELAILPSRIRLSRTGKNKTRSK